MLGSQATFLSSSVFFGLLCQVECIFDFFWCHYWSHCALAKATVIQLLGAATVIQVWAATAAAIRPPSRLRQTAPLRQAGPLRQAAPLRQTAHVIKSVLSVLSY